MSALTFLLLMIGAALHAIWNALIRGAKDRIATTMAVAGGSALFAAVVLPFLKQPASASWIFLALSTGIHLVSYSLVARAYHVADMTQVYPLMRGTAPLLTAIIAILWLHDIVPPLSWAGIVATSIGVGILVFARHQDWNRRGLFYALANAVTIAAYSAVDGAGVRQSQAPAAYALWVFLCTGLILCAFSLTQHGECFGRRLKENWWRGLVGGTGSALSYGIALWAMTRVPIPVVSAARECSIAFGTLIAVLFLKERMNASRLLATGMIVLGAVILRLA
ncbi:hypothetical protein AA101099_2342 [Neoasaia chiangmaiensis NBRC 101099]|uniref:Uncharacterized protein n=1 Tax=Neoasaia chiangmaiensis TaxID=320497 RepID=A0A1U9KSA3_9PROT|nr:EamA family transporter [Neoasaia chiangmaiensis]AQS88713.1 hypothetical protein A0U93_13195 [Neoasaia chiangmaiensis]GBR40956.1 hypothetical protein AA101099_2342 [Neoasaia chiangmaiensis NBRC 101099]GEN13670.1 membrane protein [Neoasaia chiangmaiensis]